jgi:dTDP-4-dehydrorhamnose 3,5-epimerase
MEFQSTDFPGVWVLQPKVYEDSRGFFLESYNQRLFAEQDLDYNFVQDNHARSEQKSVLRGFHFQLPPKAQAKLIRVTAGAIYDVVIDLRVGSPTYAKSLAIKLDARDFKQLLVPKGFAHAYLTLDPGTEVQYKVDDFYDPQLEGGIFWDDPDLQIEWPLKNPILSEKDKNLPFWSELDNPFKFLK